MKQSKTSFPWDSVPRIFGPEMASNPQPLLQNPELVESDIRGESQRNSKKHDALTQGQLGYWIHDPTEYFIINVFNSYTTPKCNLFVPPNYRRYRLQRQHDCIKRFVVLPYLVIRRLAAFSHLNLRIANVTSAQMTEISRSACLQDEVYA